MPRTIFFSWQADTPTRTGRNFIRDVLDEVCKRIAADTGVDEALREVGVDSDTQDVAGQPPIVDTIFKKIDASSVFVADMTFVGKRIDQRPTPNPNVLVEYGWALKEKTYERVISVMNTAYGEPASETLPFNLRHVRWPMTFHLPADAAAPIKAKERDSLITRLEKAIRASLTTIPSAEGGESLKFPAMEAKDGPARFRRRGEALGIEENFPFQAPREVFLADGPAMWFRLMPKMDPKRRWPAHELRELARTLPSGLRPLLAGSGWSFLRAEDGYGVYRPSGGDDGDARLAPVDSVALAFETGEIWSIETALLKVDLTRLFQTDIENAFTGGLSSYVEFLRRLGTQPPYNWMAGVNGTRGRHLGYPPAPGYMLIGSGPVCMADLIEMDGEYDVRQSPTAALLPFFEKIFEKCGLARPDYLPQ